ncbi:MAG: hypothetical protein HQL58_07930 [Magnetococcales bacterium]|nr:hypothetical protein [Magnetococcales bacterium]
MKSLASHLTSSPCPAFDLLRQSMNAAEFRNAFTKLSDHELQQLAVMAGSGSLSALERHWLFSLIEEFHGFLENYWTLSQQGTIQAAYQENRASCLSMPAS